MPFVEILIACLVLAALAAVAGTYSYGRLARHTSGEPSRARPVAADATALDRAIAPLEAQHSPRSGVALLADSRRAFDTRVVAARLAGRSLDLQYYYWREDATGGLLTREIVAAAERGVRVRLLIDDINTRGNDSAYLALDSNPNIEIRLFNPSRNRSNGFRRGLELVLRAFSATRRMHNKAWIADGRLAIIGGRNIGDAYFNADKASNFHDMDLVLTGPAVAQAERIFDDFWNSPTAIPIGALSRPIARRLPKRPLARREQALLRLAGRVDPAAALAALLAELRWVEQVEVISDPPEKALAAGEDGWLVRRLYETIAEARSELQIASPYFIPGERGVRALAALVARGASVQVLTNSLAATDVVAVHGAYASYRRPLLERGIALFELRPELLREDASLFGSKGASLHTKAFTVDDRLGFIGSFNFDPRSASLNTEMGVIVVDPGLVGEMRRIFAQETGPHSAYRLGLSAGRLGWSDGPRAEGLLGSEPGAGLGRRLAAGLIRLLPIESQL